jgi:formylglycine-generating enzyme required for sulfatase activity
MQVTVWTSLLMVGLGGAVGSAVASQDPATTVQPADALSDAAVDTVANQPPPGMVLIPAGEFQMGADDGQDDEPLHTVRLDAFYMDSHEVTNAQYQAFCQATERRLPKFWGMEEFRSGPEFPDHPVLGVSWNDAKAYAEWAGKRLPTEAEWEYAARGGLKGQPYPRGAEMDQEQANYRSEGSVSGGGFSANGFGLYDMAGNVREWVADYYGPDYYATSPRDNPTGPEKGKFRVVRGGGWYSGPSCQNVHTRNALRPAWVDFNVGFRCAREEIVRVR